SLKLPADKICYIQWAANPEDYDRLSTNIVNGPYAKDRYIISMGKSNRDYRTLINAFRKIDRPDLHLKIYCGASKLKNIKENRVNINHNFINFRESIKEYKNAEFAVIPLIKTNRTLGLTSMFDAMAMEKSFIITRNLGIDIDIEKEKIGLWTDPYNVDDLKNKMKFLLENPIIAKQYGNNGKKYLEDNYNYRKFCEKLYDIANRTYEKYVQFNIQKRQ
ncbi:MAG: glycosyltransferase family 4 protein, partial [Candidatus Omnitrophica bacterium]|nr:glycosyltransferase family 4 protein [Candidatus Omnitrophota bacterium]